MVKKRVRLSSDIPDLHKKERARLDLKFPKSIQMKYLGYDSRLIQHQQPTFQGQLRIPVKLSAWTPKTKYGKNHRVSLRLDKLDHHVGIAPFSVNIRSLGHYFESNQDVVEDLIITIDTWLMSPDLLDSAILEFAVTLVGEEMVSEKVFVSPKEDLDKDDLPRGPVWSVSHIPFKFKLKLLYDTREFDRSIQNSFSYYSEQIKRSLVKHEFQNHSNLDPTEIPQSNIELLKSAKYLSKQTLRTLEDYENLLNQLFNVNSYSRYKSSMKGYEKESSEFSKKLFRKLNIFEKIIRSYEKITLKNLAKFLNIRDIEKLEIWLLSLRNDYPIRIYDKQVFFEKSFFSKNPLDSLDKLFVEFFFLNEF
ncbi:MAG: hypothetical protein ACW981_00405 [Candidatus Hodarchaeales archaeon]|jgi:hypothetical protein